MSAPYPTEQIEELKTYCRSLQWFYEGGVSYFLLENIRLPDGCSPSECDALLRPGNNDGYNSRLFFSTQVTSPYPRNWTVTNARIGERNWMAFSWQVNQMGLTPAQLLREHLSALVRTQ